MNDRIDSSSLLKEAENALSTGIQYMVDHRMYSVWTGENNVGWHEEWSTRNQKQMYAGLYATCSGLIALASFDADRYSLEIERAAKELNFYFQNCADTVSSETCARLIEENKSITLKAVFFLQAYNILLEFSKNSEKCTKATNFIQNLSNEIPLDEIWAQVKDAFSDKDFLFSPAKAIDSEKGVLTTMYAYILMIERCGSDSKYANCAKQLFSDFLKQYKQYQEHFGKGQNAISSRKQIDKFQRYRIKRNFIAAFFALSHIPNLLNEDEELLNCLISSVYLSMNDDEIREGFIIKDAYHLSNPKYPGQVMLADSKVLYLESIVRLIKLNKLPMAVLEFFIDDIEEIIDTVRDNGQYLSWDGSSTFSQNVRGLTVLQTLIDLLKNGTDRSVYVKVAPYVFREKHRAIDGLSIVMFMPFENEYHNIYEDLYHMFDSIGFRLWCAFNDPYDTPIMESILDRISKAQFIIIDCSKQKPNVMYEAGLSHGLGKEVILCGDSDDVFPFGASQSSELFHIIRYSKVEPNARHWDLRWALLSFIKERMNQFCLTNEKRCKINKKIKKFIRDNQNEFRQYFTFDGFLEY